MAGASDAGALVRATEGVGAVARLDTAPRDVPLHVPGHGLLCSGVGLRLPQNEITHSLSPGSPSATKVFLQQFRQLWYLRLTSFLT